MWKGCAQRMCTIKCIKGVRLPFYRLPGKEQKQDTKGHCHKSLGILSLLCVRCIVMYTIYIYVFRIMSVLSCSTRNNTVLPSSHH